MTIQEQLQVINMTFEKLHKDFVRMDSEKAALDRKYAAIAKSISDKFTKEKEVLVQTKEDVLKFYRIAKDNSRKELVQGASNKQKPDLAKLNTLINQININNRDDYTAGQIIDLASSYVSFVDEQLREVSSKENRELKANEQAKESERSSLVDRKKQILKSCEDYLRGEDIKNLVRLFESIHTDYEITNDYFSNWGNSPIKRKRMMLIGFQQYKIDVPQMLSGTIKSSLGHHFDENTKNVNCPLGFTTDSHEEIFAEYTDLNEDFLKKGIQALILNYLRYFKASECRVSLFDYIHYNADLLGPIATLSTGKNSVIDSVPSNEKGLKQSISILADKYRKIEAKLGVQSVYEYNKQARPDDRVPLRVLIINRNEELFRSSDEADIAYLVNNAQKFGLTVIRLTKSKDGGSKGKDRERAQLAKGKDCLRIISDSKGLFYVENDLEWMPFKWLEAPSSVPQAFIDKVTNATKPVEKGTKYFTRYSMKLPTRSEKKRRPIVVPFAIDEDDKVISCEFENETFAAYIMGASRSGKSTLLHTIIAGILMNYHPDEVELWLLDFKMLEFKRYVDCRPPHVKYLLLEKSEDLVFDIIDQLTDLLNKRQYLFSQNHWSKLTEVPLDKNIPAVFVIIDEFAQMSQILKETKGAGPDNDYALKLENLLAKGAALGMKFIFASQTYTTGISGLTETACKQIQMRFALKNTADEIKQTLTLTSDEVTPELSRSIASLPPYETLFKWRTDNGDVRVGRFRNMYTENGEIETLINKINASMSPIQSGRNSDNSKYIDKHPVLIDGNQPKPFASQIQYYKQYEAAVDPDDYDDTDVFVYPGVPCSFNLARPFLLCNGTAENILLAGGQRDEKVNVLLSILNSYGRTGNSIEIWGHNRSQILRKYRGTALARRTQITDLADICSRISEIKTGIQSRRIKPALIVCLGYELLASDFEILGGDAESYEPPKVNKPQAKNDLPDMNEILERVKACSDPDEKRRIIADYNQQKAQYDAQQETEEDDKEPSMPAIYDARSDLEWIIKRASSYGVHFLFCFDQGQDFINLRMDEHSFRHKILFSMSRDESLSIMSGRKASEIGDGVCLYSNGKELYTMRPHIYRGVPCNGWMVDDDGKIVQRT